MISENQYRERTKLSGEGYFYFLESKKQNKIKLKIKNQKAWPETVNRATDRISNVALFAPEVTDTDEEKDTPSGFTRTPSLSPSYCSKERSGGTRPECTHPPTGDVPETSRAGKRKRARWYAWLQGTASLTQS